MIESWDDLRAYANGPRDGSNTRERSSFRAATALAAYVDRAGESSFDESMTDLVTDLLHLCSMLDVDRADVLDGALRHYDAERGQ